MGRSCSPPSVLYPLVSTSTPMKTRTAILAFALAMFVSTMAGAQDLQAEADLAAESTATQPVTPPNARTVISSTDAPAAMGPYSQAVQVGGTIYVSGQVGVAPDTNLLVLGGIGSETRQAMNNARMILREAGYTLDDVVYTQIFLASLDDYEAMNQIYNSYFFTAPPARSVAEVTRLQGGARVMVAMTAAK